jgi:hypothetical protein
VCDFTSRNTVLLEKLTVPHLVTKSPAFYGPEVHYRVHNSPPPDPVFSQTIRPSRKPYVTFLKVSDLYDIGLLDLRPTPQATLTTSAGFTILLHWNKKFSEEFKMLTSLLILKVKVKLSLCFNWAPHHEGVLGEVKYSSTHSLTSALDGGEWSASRPGRFTPKERAPGTHWIGGWAGPTGVLDAVVKRI